MGIEKLNTFFGNGVGNQNSALHNEACGSVRTLQEQEPANENYSEAQKEAF